MSKAKTILMLSAVLMFVVAPTAADWDPGDGHKMHYPQLPDPTGWDVDVTYNSECWLADDWQCTQTGPVTDIHFWVSWKGDIEGNGIDEITDMTLAIYDDDRTGPYSKPVGDELLWMACLGEFDVQYRHYGVGDQGWFNPGTGEYVESDHVNYYQINCTNFTYCGIEPFVQEEGKIYWLEINIATSNGLLGWKTSLDHFEDDAVWYDLDLDDWAELKDPITGESLDLAFVITPEPASMSLLLLGAVAMLRRRKK